MSEFRSFQTRVPGKWVLAGEHAVLRGAMAVALPHPEFFLELKFTPNRDSLEIEPNSPILSDLLRSLEERRGDEGRPFPKIRGRLEIKSTIPTGAGLGSSAALCVALTRWFEEPLGISAKETFEFARTLEHFFHGRSSGMDVAAVSTGEPIAFSMERGPRALGIKKLPKFTFHDTGIRTRTSECVVRVEKLKEDNQFQAVQTDEMMSSAARLAIEGLQLYDRSSKDDRAPAIGKIADAMKQAQECFYRWELVPGEAKRLEQKLLSEGALATKITGAGGGGFVVALWNDGV